MKNNTQQADFTEVLEVASKAGHILLENGAEISRVEDIMSRIASHYGVDTGNFYSLTVFSPLATPTRLQSLEVKHRPMPTWSLSLLGQFNSLKWLRSID